MAVACEKRGRGGNCEKKMYQGQAKWVCRMHAERRQGTRANSNPHSTRIQNIRHQKHKNQVNVRGQRDGAEPYTSAAGLSGDDAFPFAVICARWYHHRTHLAGSFFFFFFARAFCEFYFAWSTAADLEFARAAERLPSAVSETGAHFATFHRRLTLSAVFTCLRIIGLHTD